MLINEEFHIDSVNCKGMLHINDKETSIIHSMAKKKELDRVDKMAFDTLSDFSTVFPW